MKNGWRDNQEKRGVPSVGQCSTGLPVSVQNAMRRSGGALLRRESRLVESWIDPGQFFLIGKMKKGFANRFDFLLDRLFPFWKYLK